MRFCGHTMGTPGRTAVEAMELLKRIGFDGVEFRCAKDGQLDIERITEPEMAAVRDHAKQLGLEIVCLTPYYKDFVTPEKRDQELIGLLRTVYVASELGCRRVRCYGGVASAPGFTWEQTWAATVKGLQAVADYARPRNVTLCVEIHDGTLTWTAGETVRLVNAVGRPNVGVLFDHAWVVWAGKETVEDALALCRPHLVHVHMKDWAVADRAGNKKVSAVLGRGVLDAAGALRALAAIGYDGWVSHEYEKYWSAYLPDPEIGMAEELVFVRRALQK